MDSLICKPILNNKNIKEYYYFKNFMSLRPFYIEYRRKIKLHVYILLLKHISMLKRIDCHHISCNYVKYFGEISYEHKSDPDTGLTKTWIYKNNDFSGLYALIFKQIFKMIKLRLNHINMDINGMQINGYKIPPSKLDEQKGAVKLMFHKDNWMLLNQGSGNANCHSINVGNYIRETSKYFGVQNSKDKSTRITIKHNPWYLLSFNKIINSIMKHGVLISNNGKLNNSNNINPKKIDEMELIYFSTIIENDKLRKYFEKKSFNDIIKKTQYQEFSWSLVLRFFEYELLDMQVVYNQDQYISLGYTYD